ncbi:PhoX family protein [Brackiella oedipodis]|uniref:PhoX family protein n=1 Tax=Brackiella oedipodis TaxID=124225 RepID=UPI00056EF3E8|nr:PhoX family phosphatase [Brackiella oedipodis]
MKNPNNPEYVDPDDIGHNDSCNPSFQAVINDRINATRRNFLKGGIGATSLLFFGGVGALAMQKSAQAASAPLAAEQNGAKATLDGLKFNFNPVAKSLQDIVTVPDNYQVSVLYACGDPLFSHVPKFKNDGSDSDFDKRSGDHHDGMEFFGLNEQGQADNGNSDQGILCINHEHITQVFMHSNGGTNNTTGAQARPASEVDKEILGHGLSVIKIQKKNGQYQYVTDDKYNRRITPLTAAVLEGPAQESDLIITKFNPSGNKSQGTLNNCATGRTPWGTMLTCEENWAVYFQRAKENSHENDQNRLHALERYGIKAGQEGGYDDLFRWASAGKDDRYARWNLDNLGGKASEDYRNEANTFGYVVEFDPFDANSLLKKRSALGRFAHESAVCPEPVAGQPVVFYMGDDSKNEYIYKFVSAAKWDPSDASKGVQAGDKYLNKGTLYAAKFNADGSAEWLPLDIEQDAIKHYDKYHFKNQGDVVINCRVAADAMGATKMDRPEWCSVNPLNNEVYFTLTNNSKRSEDKIDAANPRFYKQDKDGEALKGNVNGHIIRIAEDNSDPTSTRMKWDIYLFGSPASADANVNLSALSDDNDMSSPDGLRFNNRGLLWIQTDDSAYTNKSNCMMLAALPGHVGDGGSYEFNSGAKQDHKITTQKGKNPNADTLRRFLVGPVNCEITGIVETPDNKALFINIQHPGEETAKADIGDPNKWTSHWPGGQGQRPRSATIVITRKDGGTIAV